MSANLHRLEAFCAVVDQQSISRAAARLVVTPPVAAASPPAWSCSAGRDCWCAAAGAVLELAPAWRQGRAASRGAEDGPMRGTAISHTITFTFVREINRRSGVADR